MGLYMQIAEYRLATRSDNPRGPWTKEEHGVQLHSDTHVDSPGSKSVGPWTEEEHTRYLIGVKRHGSSMWSLIAEYVGSRTAMQVSVDTIT
jgi:hypothetical protein